MSTRIRPRSGWLRTGSALLATLLAMGGLRADEAAPYRVKRVLHGCWTHQIPASPRGGFGGSATHCFHAGRAIGGVSIYNREGGDFCLRYRVDRNRLIMRDNYGNFERCLYHFESKDLLIVGDCKSAGEWKRDGAYDKTSWPCRTQESVDPYD